jgi:NSS family neurotransmitter:Na+ symporter
VFVTLPSVFSRAFSAVPLLGELFSVLFYLLLFLAALTSSISMHEICTAYIRERLAMTRRRAAWVVTAVCMVLGTACSLSFGPWSEARVAGMGLFDLFDYATSKIFMPLGGIAMCVFVGWVMDRRDVDGELTNNGSYRSRLTGPLLALIRYVAPPLILAVFLNGIFGS